MNDISQQLADRVRAAAVGGTRLAIHGSGTKRFLAGEPGGTALDVRAHRGIVSYEPTELVITARAGTALAEVESALAERNQMLGFEPPHFGDGATLGGTIACGLAGPRRPYAGAARDFVLGARIINGRGELLEFGGVVMKNVAGYDVSRLMAGSFGTLGVILEVSLKVLPRPAQEITLTYEMDAEAAIRQMNLWAAQPLPLSAAAHSGETLYIRLSGSDAGVRAARTRLGGELREHGANFWEELREHRRAFFQTGAPLWRLSVPPAGAPIDLPGKWLLDWGGAQRWLCGNAHADDVHRLTHQAGGHATLFRDNGRPPRHTRLAAGPWAGLQRRLAQAFDPAGIFGGAMSARPNNERRP
jgi:glycolate oxidase FAD binding subunit